MANSTLSYLKANSKGIIWAAWLPLHCQFAIWHDSPVAQQSCEVWNCKVLEKTFSVATMNFKKITCLQTVYHELLGEWISTVYSSSTASSSDIWVVYILSSCSLRFVIFVKEWPVLDLFGIHLHHSVETEQAYDLCRGRIAASQSSCDAAKPLSPPLSQLLFTPFTADLPLFLPSFQ